MPSKREDFDKPETDEERAARLKARKERDDKQKEEQAAALAKFEADVDAIRPKIMKRLCPTCREVGQYTGLVRGAHDSYLVSFRCSISHHWSVTVGKLEAHALRPIGMDDEPGRPVARVTLVPKPAEHEPLVPDEDPIIEEVPGPLVPDKIPLAEGTPPATVLPRASTDPGPVLTSGPVCGLCSEPIGAKYYAGVPTRMGKMDLCLRCHEANGWRP